jgi:hypothetical protein
MTRARDPSPKLRHKGSKLDAGVILTPGSWLPIPAASPPSPPFLIEDDRKSEIGNRKRGFLISGLRLP